MDLQGKVLASGEQAIETIAGPGGLFEQDPVQLWSKLLDGARDLVRKAGPTAAEIRAVQCSSQFFSLIPVDAQGEPTARMQVWMSRRGLPHARKLLEENPDALFSFPRSGSS